VASNKQLDSGPVAKEPTDEEIRRFVRDLESLPKGELTAAILIGCGSRAIGPLREYLLQGRPRGIFQPRQRAVEILAQLGAKDVLIEYLHQQPKILDPVVRFGEEAVQNTAARELSRWQTDDVYGVLREISLRRFLPGVIESLGAFGRVESVPYFVAALADDVCRSAAEEALRKLGPSAKPALIEASIQPVPSADEEIPSSKLRRKKALHILADLPLVSEDWPLLRGFLDEKDPEFVVTAARIAFQIAPQRDQDAAVRCLIEILPRADWFARIEASACLVEHSALSLPHVRQEIARRELLAAANEMATDVVLRLLVNLQKRMESSLGGGQEPVRLHRESG
jgi:hypothetical protein